MIADDRRLSAEANMTDRHPTETRNLDRYGNAEVRRFSYRRIVGLSTAEPNGATLWQFGE
jgi:hypothetical protein